MKLKFITIASLALLFLGSCQKSIFCERGNGPIVTQTLALPPIEGFDLSIAGEVKLTYGEEQSITVSGQQNVIDELELDTKGGIWGISFDKCVRRYETLVFDITLPTLSQASISGSGSIRSTNLFPDQGEIDLNISGSGDIDIAAEASRIIADITGSGDIYLEGSADEARMILTGSGGIHAFDCPVQDVEANISGSGNIRTTAEQSLDVNITGSGDVYFKGNPLLTSSITGSGEVHNDN